MTMAMPRCPIAAAVLLLACTGGSPPASPTAPAPPSVVDGLFEIRPGMALHIHCEVSGSPTVLFEAGLGASGVAWWEVPSQVYPFTRACLYDRAGIGYSDPGPRPHTSRQMVGELHALLAAAKVAGPYVLVGHSFGGINVRLYASEYPQDVAGLVLVDVATEDQLERLWRLFAPEQLRVNQEAMRAGLRASGSEEGVTYESFIESLAQLREARRALGEMPLVVLTHGKPFPKEPGATDEIALEMERVGRDLHAEVARLSANSAHVVDKRSAHYMQEDNPKLVVAAVREVVDAVRTRGRVDQVRLASFTDAGPTP